jgi:hypothetical protein
MMNDKNVINQFLDFMNADSRQICNVDLVDWLVKEGFFVKPAAINHHGNYTGGLFQHSLAVAQVLVEMTQKFDIPWSRPESPYIVGMFHDVCKLDDYIDKNASDVVVMGTGSPVSRNPEWIYNPAPMFKGHGDKSVMMLSQVMTLTEEEMLCIRFHMGAYVTDEWDSYDRAIRKYQSVLFTHTADMYASKVQDV